MTLDSNFGIFLVSSYYLKYLLISTLECRSSVVSFIAHHSLVLVCASFDPAHWNTRSHTIRTWGIYVMPRQSSHISYYFHRNSVRLWCFTSQSASLVSHYLSSQNQISLNNNLPLWFNQDYLIYWVTLCTKILTWGTHFQHLTVRSNWTKLITKELSDNEGRLINNLSKRDVNARWNGNHLPVIIIDWNKRPQWSGQMGAPQPREWHHDVFVPKTWGWVYFPSVRGRWILIYLNPLQMPF